MTGVGYSIALTSWAASAVALQTVRRLVFIEEQGIAEHEEWDDFDAVSVHALAQSTESAIGTARLLPDGHIGRMAVLKHWRGRGVGSALLQSLINVARSRGECAVVLNAQSRAIRFYEYHGFIAHGDEFLDAGIPHRRMRLSLSR